jgi:hypothetical protein
MRASGRDVVGFATDLNADQRSLESDEGALIVDVIATLCDAFLGTLLRPVGAFEIDFMRTFRGFGENAHLVGKNFDKTPGNRQPEPPLADSITKFTDFQFGEKRRVTRQDTEVSFGAWDLQFFNLLVNERAFRCDEREIYGSSCHFYFTAAIFLAFSTASSIVPTM